eukprot:CAMPEP_0201119368 /NCGR_PEP_ID=MMETSP0850-20130426/3519_1 /ASSEMBLY_ACC=CAM_ASM_000622 /TAXON_ID=183588 /ORGANISM="Pseudo-nitzschia fraudulenta, Strain WWA7" /LENGTH=32 /DNA_ID= /DNA_START= /DNA_END= /DNA_ORIENTATION=
MKMEASADPQVTSSLKKPDFYPSSCGTPLHHF